MTGVMNRDDFVAVRSFLRFLKMGILASAERARAVLDVVDSVDPKLTYLEPVALVAQSVRAGTMPSQEVCENAEKVLKDVHAAQQHNLQVASQGMGYEEPGRG